jgi:hypothetical protein
VTRAPEDAPRPHGARFAIYDTGFMAAAAAYGAAVAEEHKGKVGPARAIPGHSS